MIQLSILYDRIKAACADQDMSIASLERKSGIAMNTITSWRQYKPSFDKVAKVSNALGVSMDYLVGHIDNDHLHFLYQSDFSEDEAQQIIQFAFTLKCTKSNTG